MSYFVISVEPRGEEHFLAMARTQLPADRARVHWPRRSLTIRRRGKREESLAPVFPGYVFLETDAVDEEIYRTVKRLPRFYRFLDGNDRIRALTGDDLQLVTHFVRHGDVIGKSIVTFDENARIEVIDGPLAGLEGRIVKVDRRKQRAKVRLDLYQESFLVDFGFELLVSSSSPPPEE
jgi:transcription termination/antitermination protein NusG